MISTKLIRQVAGARWITRANELLIRDFPQDAKRKKERSYWYWVVANGFKHRHFAVIKALFLENGQEIFLDYTIKNLTSDGKA